MNININLRAIYLVFKFIRPEQVLKLVSIETKTRSGPRDV